MKQNKHYDVIHASRSVNEYCYVLFDFLFGAVTFLQANTLTLMAIVFKISCLNSIQSPHDKPTVLC